jgi:transposase InsO family protein
VQDKGIDWHFIAPGKLTDNAFIEAFNGSFRCEGANALTSIASSALPDAHKK